MLTDEHEDVQLEMRDLFRDRRDFGRVYLVVWAASFVATGLAVAALVYLARWIFSDSDPLIVAAVTCTAFLSASIGIGIYKVGRRVDRLELHALTVHNEVLTVKGHVEAAKWKS